MAPLLIAMLFIFAVVGVGGLVLLDYGFAATPRPWSHFLLSHLAGLIASVGAVGLLVEILFRRSLLREFNRMTRELFQADPTMAKLVNTEVRQKLVQNTLKAHLGEQEGAAIYTAIVHRYLVDKAPFRRALLYEITLSDLDEDIILQENTHQITLPKERYYKLSVKYAFQRAYEPGQFRHVGIILEDDINELYSWFQRKTVLFRDTIYLEEADRRRVIDLLASEDRAIPHLTALLFSLNVRINNRLLAAGPSQLNQSRKSIEITLRRPRGLKAGPSLYEIRLETIFAKSTHKYPVLLVEPSLNPRIIFSYPASITKVTPAPFFFGKAPFEPEVQENRQQVIVRLSEEWRNEDRGWVFPNSGVLFTWDTQRTQSANVNNGD